MADPGGIVTVVQGEASESEDEDTVSIHAKNDDMTQSVIVPGEAPESDDDQSERDQASNIKTHKPNDTNVPRSPVLSLRSKPDQVKYNSLLHKKLRDTNRGLQRHISDALSQTFASAAKDMRNMAQMGKTQAAIQDVFHCLRFTSNDLFQLEDRIDIVISCDLLPNITMP